MLEFRIACNGIDASDQPGARDQEGTKGSDEDGRGWFAGVRLDGESMRYVVPEEEDADVVPVGQSAGQVIPMVDRA